MNSKPASLSELTARLVVLAGMVSSDDVIMSAEGDDRSAVNRVSRRK